MTRPRMNVMDALSVLVQHRERDQLVVTNQGSARLWPLLARHDLDFHYNPSTMGGAIPLALGLAISQPQRRVLVISGDGALLMSLGSLVTVVASGVPNLSIVILNNGIYEVTGGQKTPGPSVDLVQLASSVGFATSREFSDITDWQQNCATILSAPGPRLLCLTVDAADPASMNAPTEPILTQLDRLRQAIRSS